MKMTSGFPQSGGLERRHIVACLSLFVIVLITSTSSVGAAEDGTGEQRRPMNVLLYITDEQRWDCMGAYGNPIIKTPNMDRLAETGVRFNYMFSQFPLCGPSRACFMTGQYPQAHGVHFNGVPLPIHAPRLPRTLKQHGYRTAQVGLFNIEPRAGRYYGYDVFHYQGTEYPKWAAERGVTDTYPYGGKPRPSYFYGSLDYAAEYHAASWVAETAIKVLEEIKDGPFYLEVNERYPHLPYVAPAPYDKMYDPEKVAIAPSVSRDREDFQSIKEKHAIYYGMISLVDHNFGRILTRLEELGLADNTIVIFTTDHGDMLGHHDLWSKWSLYDDDARLPFIVRYPGQPKAGMVVDELADKIDLMPTVLDLLGVPVPRGVQGRSLVPVIEGRQQGKDAVFAYQSYGDYPARIRQRRQMVRTKDWKLIHMPDSGSLLFDLKNDPFEMNNLYGAPEYRDIENGLKDRLLKWHLDAADLTIPSLFIPGEADEARQWIQDYIDPCAK